MGGESQESESSFFLYMSIGSLRDWQFLLSGHTGRLVVVGLTYPGQYVMVGWSVGYGCPEGILVIVVSEFDNGLKCG